MLSPSKLHHSSIALILVSLFALTSAASANDFTINSAVTTENGGNTLDGSDSINVTSTGYNHGRNKHNRGHK
jgi:hypothetical protein